MFYDYSVERQKLHIATFSTAFRIPLFWATHYVAIPKICFELLLPTVYRWLFKPLLLAIYLKGSVGNI